jgi:hypothetical protein
LGKKPTEKSHSNSIRPGAEKYTMEQQSLIKKLNQNEQSSTLYLTLGFGDLPLNSKDNSQTSQDFQLEYLGNSRLVLSQLQDYPRLIRKLNRWGITHSELPQTAYSKSIKKFQAQNLMDSNFESLTIPRESIQELKNAQSV